MFNTAISLMWISGIFAGFSGVCLTYGLRNLLPDAIRRWRNPSRPLRSQPAR